MISFYQSQVIFTNDQETLKNLNIFLRREECAYNLFLYMREKVLRNHSISIKFFTTDEDFTMQPAVAFYIDLCIKNEDSINKVRQNIPVFFKKAEQDFTNFEGRNICEYTFEDDEDKIQSCLTVLDGVIGQGLGNTMQ